MQALKDASMCIFLIITMIITTSLLTVGGITFGNHLLNYHSTGLLAVMYNLNQITYGIAFIAAGLFFLFLMILVLSLWANRKPE